MGVEEEDDSAVEVLEGLCQSLLDDWTTCPIPSSFRGSERKLLTRVKEVFEFETVMARRKPHSFVFLDRG